MHTRVRAFFNEILAHSSCSQWRIASDYPNAASGKATYGKEYAYRFQHVGHYGKLRKSMMVQEPDKYLFSILKPRNVEISDRIGGETGC